LINVSRKKFRVITSAIGSYYPNINIIIHQIYIILCFTNSNLYSNRPVAITMFYDSCIPHDICVMCKMETIINYASATYRRHIGTMFWPGFSKKQKSQEDATSIIVYMLYLLANTIGYTTRFILTYSLKSSI